MTVIFSSYNLAKRKQKLAERKDYYKILKVSKDADDKEIKKAYRKQAMLHHPDRHSGESEEKKANEEKLFKDVNEAFSVLSDPKKKQMYGKFCYQIIIFRIISKFEILFLLFSVFLGQWSGSQRRRL